MHVIQLLSIPQSEGTNRNSGNSSNSPPAPEVTSPPLLRVPSQAWEDSFPGLFFCSELIAVIASSPSSALRPVNLHQQEATEAYQPCQRQSPNRPSRRGFARVSAPRTAAQTHSTRIVGRVVLFHLFRSFFQWIIRVS